MGYRYILGDIAHIVNVAVYCASGMHSINDRPVAINGQVVIRPIMIVALTYDHRLLDGREAVTFLGMCSIF